MNAKFKIKSDLEFYCFLKVYLPEGYRIESEPKRSYFSEWSYNYRIYHKGKLFKEYSGNFRELKKGTLIKEAKRLLKRIGGEGC